MGEIRPSLAEYLGDHCPYTSLQLPVGSGMPTLVTRRSRNPDSGCKHEGSSDISLTLVVFVLWNAIGFERHSSLRIPGPGSLADSSFIPSRSQCRSHIFMVSRYSDNCSTRTPQTTKMVDRTGWSTHQGPYPQRLHTQRCRPYISNHWTWKLGLDVSTPVSIFGVRH